MDELDRKLLFLLAENARASFRELSQQVHLSPPAVAARIARLEREGLLLGYRALLAPEQCGYPLTALVSLSMPPAREPEFTAFIAGCPQAVSYTHLRAHETRHDLVCRLLLEKKNFLMSITSLRASM